MNSKIVVLDRIIIVCLILFVVFSIFSISITQISAGIGGIAWALKMHWTRSWKNQRWLLGVPVLLFCGACLLAVATAVDPGTSFKPSKKLLQFLIFFWVLNCWTVIQPERWGEMLKLRFSNLPGIDKLTHYLKGLTGRELLLDILFLTTLMATLYGFYQAITEGVSTQTRVEGTLSIYMTFAGLLMLVGIMALSRLLFAPKLELWVGAVLLSLLVCLLLTLTRQAWLGFLAGFVFLVFLRKPKWLLGLPVVLIVLILFAPPAVQDRLHSFANLKDATFLTRVALWKGGWAIYKDHPLTGCGFKCVDTVYPQYTEHSKILERYKGLHSNFVQLAVDTGIIGLMLWCFLWLAYIRHVWRTPGGSGESGQDRWIRLGSVAAVLAFLAGGLFEVNFYDSEVVMLLYFIMGVTWAKPSTHSVSD